LTPSAAFHTANVAGRTRDDRVFEDTCGNLIKLLPTASEHTARGRASSGLKARASSPREADPPRERAQPRAHEFRRTLGHEARSLGGGCLRREGCQEDIRGGERRSPLPFHRPRSRRKRKGSGREDGAPSPRRTRRPNRRTRSRAPVLDQPGALAERATTAIAIERENAGSAAG